MRFSVFDDVRDQLVSDDNPACVDGDLDYERCAALHNAIVKYGWTASGRPIDELPLTTCWEANEEEWEENADRLQPSMIEFLKRAYDTELPDTEPFYNFQSRDYKFFYFLGGLIGPQGHEAYGLLDDIADYPGHYMTLYTPNDRLGSHAEGLIYNQETHKCVVNFINTDFNPEWKAIPWQRLETVLSVYIDMIESQKVVCVHNDVEKPGDFKLMNLGDQGQQWISTHDRPNSLLTDPDTGVARRDDVMFGPWIVQPYTKEVLKQCLKTWGLLVEEIEQKMPTPSSDDAEIQYGLANEEMLDTAGVTEDFPRQLLLRARRPKFAFIAPGIRLPKPEDFTNQPFGSVRASQTDSDIQSKMPVLLFIGEGTCQPSEFFTHPYTQHSSIPAGLYLEGWTQEDLVPFADAVRLLLPFSIGGDDTWAQTANGISIDNKHDELYQIGDNPFMMEHGVSLLAVLQNFYAQVHQGNWSVDGRGVSDLIEKFREAESQEHRGKYIVPMGPGEFW